MCFCKTFAVRFCRIYEYLNKVYDLFVMDGKVKIVLIYLFVMEVAAGQYISLIDFSKREFIIEKNESAHIIFFNFPFSKIINCNITGVSIKKVYKRVDVLSTTIHTDVIDHAVTIDTSRTMCGQECKWQQIVVELATNTTKSLAAVDCHMRSIVDESKIDKMGKTHIFD